MGGDAPGGGADPRPSDLPASYRNPWEALAEDLRAVVADVRLRLQEFWRRNGEGDLWRPAWWPRDLAPLFWPLVVGGAVALVLALLSAFVVMLLTLLPLGPVSDAGGRPAPARRDSAAIGQESARLSSAEGNASAAQVTAAEGTAADGIAADVSGDDVSMGSRPRARSEDLIKQPSQDPTKRAVSPKPTSGADADADLNAALNADPDAERRFDVEVDANADALVVGDDSASDQSARAVDPVDPLIELLDRPEAAGLVEAAVGQPENGTLTLQLSPAFDRLSDSDRRRRAELWQRWSLELGYDHLDLRDQRSGLRGRDALVGDGMILFSPKPPA